MRKYIWLLALGSQLILAKAYAQSGRTITGTVTSYDESSPLEGVSVLVKGSNKTSGTQTDGVYYIEVAPKDSVLVFNYNGYQPFEVTLSTTNEYNIALHKQQAHAQTSNTFSATGKWRGVFTLGNGIEVPFNFDIENSGSQSKIFLINAEEKFEGGVVKQTADSLFISLDPFDNELAFGINDGPLKGFLRRRDGKGTPVSIYAEKDKGIRFTEPATQPAGDVSGTYDINFIAANGKVEKAVGLFTQTGNKLRGTFLRITGDSRYLDGVVDGNHFYLSSFIGSGPVLYKGEFTKEGKLTGTITSPFGNQQFDGTLNEAAALPDAYSLTALKNGYTRFSFSFPDVDSKPISLDDEKFKNKVVVVAITGSWCPNCMDEASFLAPWYKANKQRGVEIIAIHYERQTDTAFVRNALTRFKNRFGIEYSEVIGGIADKQKVAESLPALNTFLAFPTTIIIDKQGNVAKIHTGYSGPATGKYYTEFVKEFNGEIDALLK